MEFAGFDIGEETKEVIEDGKKKLVLCPVGVLAFYLHAWRVHGSQKAHEGLRRYCEYISMHGYRGGATKALAKLDSLDMDRAAAWMARTHYHYIKDGFSMLGYILV